jgi:hypothetical protein
MAQAAAAVVVMPPELPAEAQVLAEAPARRPLPARCFPLTVAWRQR